MNIDNVHNNTYKVYIYMICCVMGYWDTHI